MADEKQKSNIIRPKDKYIPDEQYGDWEKWRKARTIRAEGTSLGAAGETALSTQKLPAVYEAMLKKMWLAKQNEDKSDRIKKANPVMVTEFSEDAMKQLGLTKKEGSGVKPDEKNEEKDKDWLVTLFKAAIPLLTIGGGMLGSLKSMFAGGPLQGISNMMAKIFAVVGEIFIKKLPSMGGIGKMIGGFVKNVFTRLFGKGGAVIGKILGKGGFSGAKAGLKLMKLGMPFLKRLPIIGSLISLGSAFKRFSDDDPLGGLIDIGAAIAYMFPGAGTAIGIALDLLNAGSDIYEVKNGGVTGKFGAIKGMFGDFFGFIGDKIGDFITKGIEFVVDQLYEMDFMPSSLINRALDFMGLGGYKRSEEETQIEKNKKIIERKKNATGRQAKGASDTISRLEQENQDLEFKSGKISKNDYLLQEVSEMTQMDAGSRVKQREKLEQSGFDRGEIGELYRELLKATKEQNELIKNNNTSATNNTTINAPTTNSSVAPVIQHNSEGVTRGRRGRRDNTQPSYAPAY